MEKAKMTVPGSWIIINLMASGVLLGANLYFVFTLKSKSDRVFSVFVAFICAVIFWIYSRTFLNFDFEYKGLHFIESVFLLIALLIITLILARRKTRVDIHEQLNGRGKPG